MCSTRSVAFGLLLVAIAAPSQAQVVTREITQQPVETTVTRYPDQTVITRRPLPVAPAVGTIGIEPGVAPAYNPYGGTPVQVFPTAPAVTETVGAPIAVPVEPGTGTRSVRTVTVRRDAQAQPPAVGSTPRRSAKSHSTRTTTAVRTTVRRSTAARPAKSIQRPRPAALLPRARATTRSVTVQRVAGQPLVLTPLQRRVIYQNILQQQVVAAPAATEMLTYPAAPAVIPSGVVTGYTVPYPGQAAPAYPPSAYAAATYPVAYPVGAAIPASVPLAPVPQMVLTQVPQARPYSYAVVNNRVLLVDPATGTIVADVTQ